LSALRWALKASIFYGALALSWSVIGIAFTQRLEILPEYPGSFLVFEIGGHLLFGLAAGIATRRKDLALLLVSESALIDSDHLLSVLVLPILDRTAHSFAFITLASIVLAYAISRKGRPAGAIILVTVASWLAHLSFDTFLSNGNFPLFFPFTAEICSFPFEASLLFESSAILLGIAAGMIALRHTNPESSAS